MGVRYYTVTTYHCPRCNIRLGTGSKDVFHNPYNIGPPFLHCGRCDLSLLVPASASTREDEWEMKEQARREEPMARLEKDTPYESEGAWWLGGCLGVVGMASAIGVAAWLGFKAILENAAVMRTVYGVGIGVFIAVLALLPLLHKLTWRGAVARVAADTIERIEGSRKRMADPAYREKLRGLGLPARMGSDEPAFVAADLARLRARLAVLRPGSA